MSTNDLSRIQNIGGPRALGRETSLSTDKAVARPQIFSEAKTEAAVKVETDPALKNGAAPIDYERVAQIRAAVSNGTYPLIPTKLADAIIAAPMLLGAKS